MPGEQYSLCWNNFHSNLSSGFQSLLQSEDFVDVTLAVEGQYIKAHKTVLSICSSYFRQLFSVNPCKHPIVILRDVSFSVLSDILSFMYKGEVSVLQEELSNFMKVAEMLQVKGLTGGCSENKSHLGQNGVKDQQISDSPQMHNSSKPSKRPRSLKNSKSHPHHQHHSGHGRLGDVKDDPGSPEPSRKKLCITEAPSMLVESELVEPKSEPPDESGSLSDPTFADEAGMLDTSLGEPSSHAVAWTPDLKAQSYNVPEGAQGQTSRFIYEAESSDDLEKTGNITACDTENIDVEELFDQSYDIEDFVKKKYGHVDPDFEIIISSDDESSSYDFRFGGLRFLTSRKGHPVLLHNGHIYTLSHTRDNKSIWVCVKQRTLNCEGCVTTASGPMLLSYSGHNHSQLHDIIKRIQLSATSSPVPP